MKIIKPILACCITIIIVFVVASLFDIVIAVVNSRFYSTAAFITIFGVAGVFAGVMSYTYGIELATRKTETSRWSIIATIIITGLIFFFILAKIEGGEYEPAFKAFGITTALSSFLFAKGKLN